jgi:uncharacterized repeat protein (TIGR04042 family)
MPELWFTVRWPDGSSEVCYSPSTVISKHFTAGKRYGIAEFAARARAGLVEAGDRVESKYGFRCTGADEQLRRIETSVERFETMSNALVEVVEFRAEPK